MIDSLMSWLITTPGIIIMVVIALFILLLSSISNRRGNKKITWTIRLLAVLTAISPLLTMVIDLKDPPIITTTDWKTIYTNDIDAQVTLSIPTSDVFHTRRHVTAGSELGNNYDSFESASNDIAIRAAKNNAVADRMVRLSQDNIIVNGQLSEYAKITKIEYHETTKQFKHHTSSVGEIRVTIDGTKTDGDKEELERLFK